MIDAGENKVFEQAADEAERALNGYLDAVRAGAYVAGEMLPMPVVADCLLHVATTILVHEHGYDEAARRIDGLAKAIRDNGAKSSSH